MAWLVICRDVADSAALRREYLEAHLAYIEKVMDRIAVAGPLFTEDSPDDMNASCFIYRTVDLDEARALLREDPYYRAGLYEEVEFRAFRPAAGVWVGGAAWKVQPASNRR